MSQFLRKEREGPIPSLCVTLSFGPKRFSVRMRDPLSVMVEVIIYHRNSNIQPMTINFSVLITKKIFLVEIQSN